MKYILVYCLGIILGIVLAAFTFERYRQELEKRRIFNINAITMPDNCYEQLANSKMIQIKIIKE